MIYIVISKLLQRHLKRNEKNIFRELIQNFPTNTVIFAIIGFHLVKP